MAAARKKAVAVKKKRHSGRRLAAAQCSDVGMRLSDGCMTEGGKSERDEHSAACIVSLFQPYERLLGRLKQLLVLDSGRHRVGGSELSRLLAWLQWDDARLAVLEQAWSHERFWPFVNSAVASRMVQEFPPLLVARLSSSKAGMLTVTRLDLQLKFKKRKLKAVHKQHSVLPSGMLATRWALRSQMTFEQLMRLLVRDTCPFCLKNVQHGDDYRTFGCRHSYHESCLPFGDHCELCSSAPLDEAKALEKAMAHTRKVSATHGAFHATLGAEVRAADCRKSPLGSAERIRRIEERMRADTESPAAEFSEASESSRKSEEQLTREIKRKWRRH